MKKTSLMLAVGALLYGTSGTYAIADVISFDEVSAILSQASFEEVPFDPAEDEDVSVVQGTDPFTIPSYVTVIDVPSFNDQIDDGQGIGMCSDSFHVNGEEMALNNSVRSFDVTVTFADDTTQEVKWEENPPVPLGGVARGDGWFLAEADDTWYLKNPWILYTESGVSITKIKIDLVKQRIENGPGIFFAFDIGGKNRYTTGDPQHTPGSSNGRVITLKKPPIVIFEAIYSNPVYVQVPPPPHTPDSPHDLYGTLEIVFDEPVGGATAIEVPAFAFVADTDCLPVEQVQATSTNEGFDITLTGEGLMVVGKTCDDGTTGSYAYDVPRDNLEISVPSTALTAGCCYSFTDENGSEIPLEVDGNPEKEYCYR